MPRNGSGSFSLTTTFAANTLADVAPINTLLQDVRDEITNSVAKDGQTTLTGPLKASDGTVSAPGLAFGADTNTGWYRIASGKTGYSADGVLVATLDATGFTLNSGTFLGALAANSVTLAKIATQADATVLANVSGGAAAPSAVTYAALMDDAFGTTQGTILYRSGSAWATLGVGTSGQFLKTQGAAADPAWADALPTQTSKAGYQLVSNGTAASWSNDSVVRARGTATGVSTPVVSGAVNVASVTRTGTGTYDVVFTNALASTAYQPLVTILSPANTLTVNLSSKSTTGFTAAFSQSGSLINPTSFDFVVFGGY